MDLGRGAFRYKPRRQKLQIDDEINGIAILDFITALAAYRHTQEEAAALLGVAASTFKNFIADNPEAKDAWHDGRQINKASVRRLLYMHAKGDPSTARFLAKNILRMTDDGAKPGKDSDAATGIGSLPKREIIARILELQAITTVDSNTASGEKKRSAPLSRALVRTRSSTIDMSTKG